MEVDKLAVMEMIHNVNFFPDQCFFHGMTNGDELGSKYMLSLQFSTPMDYAKGSSTNLLEYVIVVIHTVLCLDFHWLRNIFGIDIKDKLVIISNFTFLSSDFLASVRVNFVLSSSSLLLENSLCLAKSTLIAGIWATIHVLSKHSESVFIARNQASYRHQSEASMPNTAPTGHR